MKLYKIEDDKIEVGELSIGCIYKGPARNAEGWMHNVYGSYAGTGTTAGELAVALYS